MTGDQADFLARLKRVLPRRWFPDQTPVLDGILTGFASSWAWLYALLSYTRLQTRIATATDIWLDAISLDFFGGRFSRRPGEPDASFSQRIRKEILRPRATRAALTEAVTDLTGAAPTVFEPRLASDTGGYGFAGMTLGTGLGYGVAGGYGSLALPFQFFVTATRPATGGIAGVAGYYLGAGWAGGGYGGGAIEYGSLSLTQGQITDADIAATIAAVIPASTIAWLRIGSPGNSSALGSFILGTNTLF